MIFKKLLADYEERPIGITKPPRLSWVLDNEAGQEYFIVNISTDKNMTNSDVLGTEKIYSDKLFYDCRNLKLKPFTRYFWRVGVCGKLSGKLRWSETQEFVTSILNRSQWKALQFRHFETVNVCMDKKEFTLDRKPEKAYLFIAASGEKSNGCHIYINGEQITKGMIMPGPAECMTMKLSGFDVTELLSDKNIINIDHVSGISCVLKIYYSDGTKQTIETDKTWGSYIGESPYLLGYNEGFTPTRHHGKFERFDKTKVLNDWYIYGTKTSDVGAPDGTFWGALNIRYSGIKTEIHEKLAPVSIIKAENGYICDFGKIQSGFIKITVHNCKNTVKIQYAEYAENDEVSMTQYGNEYPPVCEFIPVGEDNEEYTPYFMHTSFRYVFVSGLDYEPAKEDFTAYFIYSDIDGKSSFSCSNEKLNYLDKCIRRSYRSNLLNVPTDCPGRERRGWSADSYAVIDSQCFMYDVYKFYDRWFCDLHDNQRIIGWCTVEYPDQTDPCIDINWPMHIIIDPWTMYEHYGDIRILENNIESMEKYGELLYSLSDNHLFAENLFSYGDWVSIERADSDYLGAAFYYYVTTLLAKAEKALGRDSLSRKYSDRSAEISKSLNDKYYHGENGMVYYDNNTQSANVLALGLGFCQNKERVFATLIEDIETSNTVTVGVFGNTWLYNVLGENGRNDLAYRLLTDENVQGSGMLKMVNKLKNETLNESFKTTRDSLNHMFLGGGAASWFYRHLMGIKCNGVGFESYSLNPYFPDALNNLEIGFDTPYGRISLSWSRIDSEIALMVLAPCGSCGEIMLGQKSFDLKSGENRFINSNYEWFKTDVQ